VLAVSGDVIAAGTWYGVGDYTPGIAWIFARTDDLWTERAVLTAPDDLTPDFNSFGTALDIEDLVVLAGAPMDDYLGTGAGALYVLSLYPL
jgi:hypothetical protein